MIRKLLQDFRRRYWILPRMHRTYSSLSVRETFRKIYLSKAWGDNPSGFCSGAGSSGLAAEQYCIAIVDYIHKNKIRWVVDLGCGDFAVGRRFVEACGVHYTGVDVVPELIEHHRQTVNDPRVSFQCADITCDRLPAADLCLVRQVLQHLSNDEIARVMANIAQFRMVLVSEDVPMNPRSFNRDKPHGPDVRAYYGSGVYLDQPPFSLPARELWTFGLRNDAVLRTVLYAQPGSGGRG